MEAETACESEAWVARVAALNFAQQRLGTEIGSERQQRSVNTVGLVTELQEMRSELAREVEFQKESSVLLNQYTSQTSWLQQSVQEEQSAHAALSERLTQCTQELREQTSELVLSVEASMSDGLRSATDSAQLGKEELWHVFNALQEHNACATEELRELGARTQVIEVDRLGKFAGQFEEIASLNGNMSAKVEILEECSIKEQAAVGARLDNCVYDLDRTREIVESLVSESGNQDFIESPNTQFRLYLTPDGDVAVYQRNNWGKWSDGDFKGVPCWHAGCQAIGPDRPLCSVNREMQAHEKDRFMALANRAQGIAGPDTGTR